MQLFSTDYGIDVNSAGLILTTAGMVYWAENAMGSFIPDSYEQKMRVGAYNSITNSLVYHRYMSNDYGVSASLVHGPSTGAYNYLYVGGSVESSI